jgi:hypothetical protein
MIRTTARAPLTDYSPPEKLLAGMKDEQRVLRIAKAAGLLKK